MPPFGDQFNAGDNPVEDPDVDTSEPQPVSDTPEQTASSEPAGELDGPEGVERGDVIGRRNTSLPLESPKARTS